MEGLKDDADILAAEARQRVLVEFLQVFAGDDDGAAIGPFEPRHHHQQRRFARAGRAEQGHGLAAAYIEIDVVQDMNASGAAAEREIDPAQRNRVRLR